MCLFFNTKLLPLVHASHPTWLPSSLFLLWLQPNNESPKPIQLSTWGRSGHAPLDSPAVAFCCRHCFEAGCSGTWAASGVRSCQRGGALSHILSHHTCLALPIPLSHCITLSVCVTCLRRWATLSAAAACYQSLRQGELKMSWVRACKTDWWPCCHPAGLCGLSSTHILGLPSSSAHPD